MVGQWLLAGLLNQVEEREKLGRMLNGGKSGWNYDEPAVVEIACQLAARHYFGNGINVYVISAFVTELRGRIHSTTPPDQEKTEALLRHALGDRDVAVSHIAHLDMFYSQGAIFGQIVHKLGLKPTEIKELIIQAELQAFEQGWNPPVSA